MATKGGGRPPTREYRVRLDPRAVTALKRRALDDGDRAGRSVSWVALLRELMSKEVAK